MPEQDFNLPPMYSAPMASGIPHTPTFGFTGVPGVGDGRLGMAGQFLLQPQLQRMMGQQGFSPMGVGHDQNVLDFMRRQQFTQMQNQTMQLAAQMDRENMMKTFRGMSAMAGVPFGAEQRRAANALTDLMATGAPMLVGLNADLFDQLGGSRGSAAVMAHRVAEAGRYRIDPVTGRRGLSDASTAFASQNLYDNMYLHGDPKQMMGMSAGQSGALMDELQRRGMIGTAGSDVRASAGTIVNNMARTSPNDLSAAVRRTGVPNDLSKWTAADLDKITLDDTVANKLRSFDTDKIKRSLQSYAGAVSAIRDIFGDMGKPNAPMRELMGGLEMMTMGSMHQLDPSRVGMMVRQTYQLARQSGVPLENAMVLQQHAGARAQQLGLEPIFAVNATQGALAFGGAYRSLGQGAHTAWGSLNADQVTQFDANLRLQAAGSNLANQFAAFTRLSEAVGGFKADKSNKPGEMTAAGDARRLVNALRGEQNQYISGAGGKSTVQSVNMSTEDMLTILRNAKTETGEAMPGAENAFRTMLGQKDVNREYTQKHGLDFIVRREQAAEVAGVMARSFEAILPAHLEAAGSTGADARKAAVEISQRVAKRVMALDRSRYANTTFRTQDTAAIIEQELRGIGLTNMPGREGLQAAAEIGYGQFGTDLTNRGYGGNQQTWHQASDPRTMARADRDRLQTSLYANLQEALAPLGGGTMIRKMVDAFQGIRPGDKDALKTVMMKITGGIPGAEINKVLYEHIAKLHSSRAQYDDLVIQINKTEPGEQQDKLRERARDTLKEIEGQTKTLSGIANEQGLGATTGITREDLRRGAKSSLELLNVIRDTSGIRGAFGRDVSDVEIGDLATEYNSKLGKRTETESAIAIAAWRQAEARQRPSDAEADAFLAQQKKLGFNLGDRDTARDALTRQRLANVAIISREDIDKFNFGGILNPNDERVGAYAKASLKALALHRRMGLAVQADPAEVERILRTLPAGTERAVAVDMANTNQRAKRLGISDDDIKAHIAKQGGDRYSAIHAITAERESMRYIVTDEQVKEAQKSPLFAGMGPEQTREAILTQRRDAEADSFKRLLAGPDGFIIRDAVSNASEDIENQMNKFISSPEVGGKLGMQSLKYAQDLKETQLNLHRMAAMYTRGDMTNLLIGNLTGIDTTTLKGAELARKVREDTVREQNRQQQIMLHASGQLNATGPSLQISSVADTVLGGGITDPKDPSKAGTLAAAKGRLLQQAEAATPIIAGEKDEDRKRRVTEAAIRIGNSPEFLAEMTKLGEGPKLIEARQLTGNIREAMQALGLVPGRDQSYETMFNALPAEVSLLGVKVPGGKNDIIKMAGGVELARHVMTGAQSKALNDIVPGLVALKKQLEGTGVTLEQAFAGGFSGANMAEIIKGSPGLTPGQIMAGVSAMKELGVTNPEDAIQLQSYRRNVDAKRLAMLSHEERTAVDMVGEFQGAFGFGAGSFDKSKFAMVAQPFANKDSRYGLQAVIAARRDMLEQAGGSQAALQKMIGDYTIASDPKLSEEDRKKAQGEFKEQFRNAYDLLNKIDPRLLQYGPSGELGEEHVGGILRSISQAGQLVPPTAAERRGLGDKTTIEGRLSLDIAGMTADINATTGGNILGLPAQ